MTVVLVPPERWRRWLDNFAVSHGEPALSVADGLLMGSAPDGSSFTWTPPFGQQVTGLPDPWPPDPAPPRTWGVLLVRKGGFAIARVERRRIVASKIGRRHVQGRTKAGGQSQQRFARRRGNQARQAFEAAADHAAQLLAEVEIVVLGGDRTATSEVLRDPRLRHLRSVGPLLDVPDPRRAELERAVLAACSARIAVVNAQE